MYTGNEVNGGIAVVSTGLSFIISPFLTFMIAPENVWMVQLAVTTFTAFVLFGIGKGVDVWLRLRDEKKKGE